MATHPLTRFIEGKTSKEYLFGHLGGKQLEECLKELMSLEIIWRPDADGEVRRPGNLPANFWGSGEDALRRLIYNRTENEMFRDFPIVWMDIAPPVDYDAAGNAQSVCPDLVGYSYTASMTFIVDLKYASDEDEAAKCDNPLARALKVLYYSRCALAHGAILRTHRMFHADSRALKGTGIFRENAYRICVPMLLANETYWVYWEKELARQGSGAIQLREAIIKAMPRLWPDRFWSAVEFCNLGELRVPGIWRPIRRECVWRDSQETIFLVSKLKRRD